MKGLLYISHPQFVSLLKFDKKKYNFKEISNLNLGGCAGIFFCTMIFYNIFSI